MRLREQPRTCVFRGSTVAMTLSAASLLVTCTECVCVYVSVHASCQWLLSVDIQLWCFSSQNNNHCDGFFLAGSTYVRRLIDININNSHLKVCYNYYNCNYSILLLF